MRHLTAALIATTAILSACGGGGDDPAPAYLAGTYNATLTKTQDNCFIGGPYNGSQHVVTLEGSSVTVQVNTLTMVGGARDDGGLSATWENKTADATATASVTYFMPAGLTAPGNGTFNAELMVRAVANSNGFTCTLKYNGTVTKVS